MLLVPSEKKFKDSYNYNKKKYLETLLLKNK